MQAALATASILLGQFHQLGVQLGRYTSLDPLEEVEKNASALPSPAWKTDSTKFSVVLKSGGRSQGITEIGCMAHARRKFFDLHVANKSQLAEQALHSISGLYEVERQARDMSDEERWRIRQELAVPILKKLHDWMLAQRDLVPNGSATAKALDYSLKRWVALTRYLDDGLCPSITIRSRTKYGHGRSGVRTGCLPGRCAVVNGRLQS